MSILEIADELLEPVEAHCNDQESVVTLSDGAKIVTPLWWYPRLQQAEAVQRDVVELSPFGVHWRELDEDLSIEGMLKGHKARNAVAPLKAAE